MSLREVCRQADLPRTATSVTTLRWKQSSGRPIYLFFTYGLPVFIGVGRWLASGTVQEALMWAGGGFFVGCYLIVIILTTNYLVGPSEEEYREILNLFERNADNQSDLRMALKKRRFNLYCEVTPEKADHIGVKLPRKYWDDLLDDEAKQELLSAGAGEIVEAEKNIYAFWSRQDRNTHSVLDCLFGITGTSLAEFAVSPITSTCRHVFSDHPEKASFPNEGVKKK